MIGTSRQRVLILAVALLFAGIAYSQMPAQKTEAGITSNSYSNFSYNPATQFATWNFTLTINDTFNQHFQFTAIGPAGSIVTASVPATCTGLPRAVPVDCDLNFPPGITTLTLTIQSPFPQLCTAQVVSIGAVTVNQSSVNSPGGVVTTFPAQTQSLVGGILVNNTVPANTLLCPTPTPTTTPVAPTATPAIPVVIPQVIQNPARGGIFNGSRNDTPTPIRPREVGTAGSTGIGLDPGAVVLRPPSTGNAGMLTLRRLRLNAW